jgi:hypothetical protein
MHERAGKQEADFDAGDLMQLFGMVIAVAVRYCTSIGIRAPQLRPVNGSGLLQLKDAATQSGE